MVETQKKVEELKKTYLSWSLHDSDVRREGIAIGEARGEKRGRSEAKLEAARNMLLENLPVETVVRCTGFPLETVQQLARFAEAQPTD
ncbi:MAG: hypothetical protein IKK38_02970 [Spirochaetaceae bacterium]|nr:hypothetical protein [Spirochaetaceae bacterium]